MNKKKMDQINQLIAEKEKELAALRTQLYEASSEPTLADRWLPDVNDYVYYVGHDANTLMTVNGLPKETLLEYEVFNAWSSEEMCEEVANDTRILWYLYHLHNMICPEFKDLESGVTVSFSTKLMRWIPVTYRHLIYGVPTFDTFKNAERAAAILNEEGIKPSYMRDIKTCDE